MGDLSNAFKALSKGLTNATTLNPMGGLGVAMGAGANPLSGIGLLKRLFGGKDEDEKGLRKIDPLNFIGPRE